jgi:NADPH:quinone reductase-like Zn-dependent oxidoreductase
VKSFRLNNVAAKPALIQTDIPQPSPQKGEVLVRVHAAGVTQTELSWYPTTHTRNGGERTGAVPAHEFSGEIAALGEGVADLSLGQEIYGMNDWFEDGAIAEYCLTQPDWIAPKPHTLTHVEAASVPIGALTAWQGLFDRAKLQPGERLLVQGGAGAVGTYAIQLGRLHGARVIATASSHNLAFVKQLGADEVLDYQVAPFEEQTRNIDVLFDAVGGDVTGRSWGVLNPAGRLVVIASDHEADSDERIKAAFFIVEPRRQQLVEVGKLIDAGKLKPVVDTVLPFAQASDAYDGTVKKKGRGKVVIALDAAPSGQQGAHALPVP